ncbi:MAG: DUF3307 domain-containing protein [Candidatus Zixiibacteriota bacterium]|nr:MAG: DUF3307 domain-containing protein [candidate division Zixibacteria bacterium]
MIDLLFFLILGHLFGDFGLQSDRVAAEKGRSKATLTYHVFLYTLTVALFLFAGLALNGSDGFFRLATLLVLTFIFLAHWIQDYLKAFRFNGTKQAFYLDQAVHILILFAVRILIYNGQA